MDRFIAAVVQIASGNDREANLPPIEELSGIARDFEATGVSLKRHPIACIRPRLTRACVVPCAWLRDADLGLSKFQILQIVGAAEQVPPPPPPSY